MHVQVHVYIILFIQTTVYTVHVSRVQKGTHLDWGYTDLAGAGTYTSASCGLAGQNLTLQDGGLPVGETGGGRGGRGGREGREGRGGEGGEGRGEEGRGEEGGKEQSIKHSIHVLSSVNNWWSSHHTHEYGALAVYLAVVNPQGIQMKVAHTQWKVIQPTCTCIYMYMDRYRTLRNM